jgi:hypothetical protein
MHDEVGNPNRTADTGEQGDVRLAPALDDRDRFTVGVVPQSAEDEREDELLRSPLDEERGPGEEELAALGVELSSAGSGFG